MAFNLGDIFVTFKANTDALKNALTEVDKLSSKAGTAGKAVSEGFDNAKESSEKFALGLTVAGAAVVGFGVLSVKSFTDSQDKIAQTDAVLRSTAHAAGIMNYEVSELASALEAQTKFSDEDVRSVENLLLTFTSIGKDIFPQATETVLDMATALGEDTASASIQLGKALQDPILGVTALRRVGVNFSEKQTEVIKKLVDTGKSAQAQKMILAELTKEFGGSAKAAGQTFSGKMAELKNKIDDVQEAIGGLIVDAIEPLVVSFSAWIDSLGGFETIQGKIQLALQNLAKWFPVIIGLIVGGLTPAMLALAASIASTVFWLAPFLIIGAALGALWTKHKALFFTLAGAVAGFAIAIGVILLPTIIAATAAFAGMAVAVIAATWPFVLIGAAIAGAAYLIITNWSAISAFFVQLWNQITSATAAAWDWIKNIVSTGLAAIWSVIKPYVDLIGAYFYVWWWIISYVFALIRGLAIVEWNFLWNNILKPVVDFFVTAWKFAAAVFGIAMDAMRGPAQAFSNWLMGLFNGLVNWLRGLWNGFASWLGGVWNSMTGPAGKAGSAMANAFGGAFNGVKGAVLGAMNWLIDKVNGAINTVNNAATKLPGVPRIPTIAHLASGTPDFRGGLAVVGEQGEELVELPAGSKVHTAQETKAMLGGGTTINVTINKDADTDYFFSKFGQNQILAGRGMASTPGTVGV